MVVAAMAPQRRLDRPLRFPEILDRWRVAATTALRRQPPGRHRAPSGASRDPWVAVAAAALPSWPPDYRRPYRGFCTGGGRSLRRRCHGALLTGRNRLLRQAIMNQSRVLAARALGVT